MSVVTLDFSFLKKYMQRGESFIETSEEHLAILLARHLDAERRAQLEADVAAIDAPVSIADSGNVTINQPVTETPVEPAPAVDAEPAAAQPAVEGTDANGSPV